MLNFYVSPHWGWAWPNSAPACVFLSYSDPKLGYNSRSYLIILGPTGSFSIPQSTKICLESIHIIGILTTFIYILVWVIQEFSIFPCADDWWADQKIYPEKLQIETVLKYWILVIIEQLLFIWNESIDNICNIIWNSVVKNILLLVIYQVF